MLWCHRGLLKNTRECPSFPMVVDEYREQSRNTRVSITTLPKTSLGWFLIRLPHFRNLAHAVLISTGAHGDATQKAIASPRCCYPSLFIRITIVWRWRLVRSEEVATAAAELIVFALGEKREK